MIRIAAALSLALALAPRLAAAQDAPPPGGGQMPDPRMMSGQVRGQEGDPVGRLTVRAVQGKLRVDELGNRVSDWPKDAVIHLVTYAVGEEVSLVTRPLDAEGRAIFDGLVTDGSRAYRAIALFGRPGAEDRLISQPIIMPPQVGLRLMLAGEAPDSTAPAVDDQSRSDEFGDGKAPAAGAVIVRLRGQTKSVGKVHLLEIGGAEVAAAEAILQKVVLGATLSLAAPVVDPALRDGLVQVKLAGPGEPGHAHGLTGASLEVRDAAAPPDAVPIATATTGGEGVATFDALPAGKRYVVRASLHGEVASSAPFDLPAKGGVLIGGDGSFTEEASLEARFSGIAGGADKVYLASVEAAGRTYLSTPIMLTAARGAATGIFVYPELVFSFHGGSEVDDQRIFFQVQLSLINPTNSPRDPGPAGLSIPLPRGFAAASVDEKMAARVKVDDAGLVWRGAVPPGQRDFIASFALDIERGGVSFELPLPHGAWQSQVVFEDFPGVTIEVPASAKKEKRRGDNGKSFVVLGGIDIEPGQSMVVRLSGLPQPSSLQFWARILAGFGVLGLLGWAVVAVVRANLAREPAPAEAERERLFGELVGLEQRFADGKLEAARYQRERTKLVDALAALAADAAAPAAAAATGGGEA